MEVGVCEGDLSLNLCFLEMGLSGYGLFGPALFKRAVLNYCLAK